MTNTVVHLLRHGKVQNPNGILYGRIPGYVLADSGRQMATAVAEYLAPHNITHVVASSLIRAQETAEPVAAAHGLEIVTDDRVIEADNIFEGQQMTAKKNALYHPKNWSKLRNVGRPSWGEPYLTIAHRMLAAVYDAAERAGSGEAVIVSHQLPIVTIRRYLSGERLWHNPANRACNVASLTTLSFQDGIFSGYRYVEPAAHIPAVNNGESPSQEHQETGA